MPSSSYRKMTTLRIDFEETSRNAAVINRHPLLRFDSNDRNTLNALNHLLPLSSGLTAVSTPATTHVANVQKAKALGFVVRPDRSLAQASLAWLLQQDGVSTVIAGSANRQQLEWNMAASDVPGLTDDDLSRIADLQETNFGVPVG